MATCDPDSGRCSRFHVSNYAAALNKSPGNRLQPARQRLNRPRRRVDPGPSGGAVQPSFTKTMLLEACPFMASIVVPGSVIDAVNSGILALSVR